MRKPSLSLTLTQAKHTPMISGLLNFTTLMAYGTSYSQRTPRQTLHLRKQTCSAIFHAQQ
jgi:hypothetical protein